MEDFPWLPVAMIFIAFVGWIRNRLLTVAERRKERRSPATAAEASPSPPPESLSEVFEHLRQANQAEDRQPPSQETPDREAEKKVQPPPLPSSRRKTTPPETPRTSVLDESLEIQDQAPAPVQDQPPISEAGPSTPAPSPRTAEYRTSKFETRNPVASRLVHSLKNRDKLRSALLLKEILDSPVSLREGGHSCPP